MAKPKKTFLCPECERPFESERGLKTHLNRTHGAEKKGPLLTEETTSDLIGDEVPRHRDAGELLKPETDYPTRGIVLPKINFTQFFSAGWLRWVVLAGVLALVVKIIADKSNSKKIDRNNEKIEVEARYIDSLKEAAVINGRKAEISDSFAKEEVSKAAEAEAIRKVLEDAYFNGSKQTFEKTLNNINQKSNETRKAIQDADFAELDNRLQRVEESRRYKNLD